MQTPPLASNHNFLGHIRRAHGDILEFMTSAGQESPVVELDYKFGRTFLVSDPDGVEQILLRNVKNYSRLTRPFGIINKVVGGCLFTQEGDAWRNRRKISQPAFHSARLEDCVPAIVSVVSTWIEEKRALNKPLDIDLSEEMGRMTLNILAKTVFDLHLSAEEIAELQTDLESIAENIHKQGVLSSRVPPWLPLPFQSEQNRMKEKTVAKFSALLRDFKPSPTYEGSLLHYLTEEFGAGSEHILNEVFSFLLVGRETTGYALAWTWYLLSQNPHYVDRLRQEHTRVVGTSTLNVDHMDDLLLSKYIFQESLRLYPPGWKMSRLALADDTLCGFHIPAGSTVQISPWVTHRLSTHWQEPLRFFPERFADTTKMHKFQYFPFGLGPRICIGINLAAYISQAVLSLINNSFSIELLPQNIKKLTRVTMRPGGGLKARINSI